MEDQFGSKLKKARSRLGLSLKDASEATKIRTDFLESFESDHGNFDMPGVYKRGFIKLYARFLKLDPNSIAEDWDLYQEGSTSFAPSKPQDFSDSRDEREVLGRIDLAIEPSDRGRIPAAEKVGGSEMRLKGSDPVMGQSHGVSPMAKKAKKALLNIPEELKSLYLKVGLIFGGGLAAVILVVVLISSLVKSKPTHAQEDLSVAVAKVDSIASHSAVDKDFIEELKLLGEGDVHVVVRQENDKERLFSGNLDPKKPVALKRKGPVKVHFSNGSNLVIQRGNGEKIRPSREGVGWIEI